MERMSLCCGHRRRPHFPTLPPPFPYKRLPASVTSSPPPSLSYPNSHSSRCLLLSPAPLSSRLRLRSLPTCSANRPDIISQLELERPGEKKKPETRVNGIFWILLLNLGIFVADRFFQVQAIKSLYFYHNRPAWYQFVTSTFCHVNWNHLSSNLFFLYIFGKLVEEEEGNFGLWFSYILTGAGANLVSWLILPRNAVSVGASGAVFGLFAISVLVKMSFDWRKILEVLILGQFVIERVMEATQASTGMVASLHGGHVLQSINHIAHLSGALIGVVLVWLVSRIPSSTPDPDTSIIRMKHD